MTVWEDGTIGGIVLDGTAFDVYWSFREVVSLEVLSADKVGIIIIVVVG